MIDRILFVAYFVVVSCNVQFDYNSQLCLDEFVEFQCTVQNGSEDLRWRVRNDGGTNLGTVLYELGEVGAPATIHQGIFSIEPISQSPIVISNISFTVQSDIDGYTVICSDNSAISESFVIDVQAPTCPENVAVQNYESSFVSFNWTAPNFTQSRCFQEYRYNVSSTAPDKTIEMMSTSDNSVMVEGLNRSMTPYRIVVTTSDINNNVNSGCNSVDFLFDVPGNVSDLMISNETDSDTTVELMIEWEQSMFNVNESIVTVPAVKRYRVMIVNSTDPNDFNKVVFVPSNMLEHTFTGVPLGRTYTISVTAENDVGMSEPITQLFEVTGPFVDLNQVMTISSSSSSKLSTATATSFPTISSTPVTLPSSTVTELPSISSTGTSSPSPPVSEAASNSLPIIVGVVVAVVALILIAVIVVLLIVFVIYRKNQTKSVDLKVNEKGGDNGVQLKEKNPDVGQPLYPNDATDGGDSNLPTYQDPSTIQRQEAPTGDLYAMPEKSEKKPQQPAAVGGEYAELDLTNKSTPTATTSTVPAPSQDPSAVVYSDIRGAQ